MSRQTFTLNDGTQIPWIAFGTGTVHRDQDVSATISLAIANGITHLDGAQMYKNEEWVGKAIASSGRPRSELYVTTKLDEVPEGRTVRDMLMESLTKLHLDYVDLFLIHVPVHHPGRLQTVWKELEALHRDGLTKSIGVSNFPIKHLEEILEGATMIPAINQESSVLQSPI